MLKAGILCHIRMTPEEVLTEEDATSWPSSLHLLLCHNYTLHMFLKKVKTLKVIDFTQSKIFAE